MLTKGRRASFVGALNGRAKIDAAQAIELRARYAAGEAGARILGLDYGLSESQAFRVIKGISWRSD
jgi:hypothetical protein